MFSLAFEVTMPAHRAVVFALGAVQSNTNPNPIRKPAMGFWKRANEA